jgi:hypothetical protein
MISAEEMKAAYDAMIKAAKAFHEADAQARKAKEDNEDTYNAKADEARLDGISDEGKIHNKALKGARKTITALRIAEKKAIKAKNDLQICGMEVDSLVRQQDAYKQAAQK